jgi:flagellar capping protein FliD
MSAFKEEKDTIEERLKTQDQNIESLSSKLKDEIKAVTDRF